MNDFNILSRDKFIQSITYNIIIVHNTIPDIPERNKTPHLQRESQPSHPPIRTSFASEETGYDP